MLSGKLRKGGVGNVVSLPGSVCRPPGRPVRLPAVRREQYKRRWWWPVRDLAHDCHDLLYNITLDAACSTLEQIASCRPDRHLDIVVAGKSQSNSPDMTTRRCVMYSRAQEENDRALLLRTAPIDYDTALA